MINYLESKHLAGRHNQKLHAGSSGIAGFIKPAAELFEKSGRKVYYYYQRSKDEALETGMTVSFDNYSISIPSSPEMGPVIFGKKSYSEISGKEPVESKDRFSIARLLKEILPSMGKDFTVVVSGVDLPISLFDQYTPLINRGLYGHSQDFHSLTDLLEKAELEDSSLVDILYPRKAAFLVFVLADKPLKILLNDLPESKRLKLLEFLKDAQDTIIRNHKIEGALLDDVERPMVMYRYFTNQPLAKHLAGRHDQKRHAGKSTSKKTSLPNLAGVFGEEVDRIQDLSGKMMPIYRIDKISEEGIKTLSSRNSFLVLDTKDGHVYFADGDTRHAMVVPRSVDPLKTIQFTLTSRGLEGELERMGTFDESLDKDNVMSAFSNFVWAMPSFEEVGLGGIPVKLKLGDLSSYASSSSLGISSYKFFLRGQEFDTLEDWISTLEESDRQRRFGTGWLKSFSRNRRIEISTNVK